MPRSTQSRFSDAFLPIVKLSFNGTKHVVSQDEDKNLSMIFFILNNKTLSSHLHVFWGKSFCLFPVALETISGTLSVGLSGGFWD